MGKLIKLALAPEREGVADFIKEIREVEMPS